MITKLLLFLLGLLGCHVLTVNADIGDIVLQLDPFTQAGLVSSFLCTCYGADNGDPIFSWSIRVHDDQSNILVPSSALPTPTYDNDDNPADGVASSRLTLIIQEEYIDQDLWCVVSERGGPGSHSKSIHGPIERGMERPTGGLDQSCNVDATCDSVFFTCDLASLVCVCADGFTKSGSQCVPSVGIGGTCVNDDSCRPDNSFCNSQQRCECNNGYVHINSECLLETVQLGDPCLIGQNCRTQFSECSSSLARCVCIDDYFRLDFGSTRTCQPKKYLGETCDTGNRDSCITPNANCDTAVCTCDTNYVEYQSSCLPSVTVNLGESCDGNALICSVPFSICTGSPRTCQCDTLHYQLGNTCNEKVGLGGFCLSGYDSCSTNGALCINGQCLCNTAADYVQSGNTCILRIPVYLNDPCDGQTQICSVTNSICTGNPATCQCSGQFYAFGDNCNPKESLGALCPSGYDSCLNNGAVCINGQCECNAAANYVQIGSSCIIQNAAGLGEACDGQSLVCSVPNSFCSGSPLTCQCINGYFRSGDTCSPSGGIGALCSTADPSSCQTVNSECRREQTGERCVCKDGYEYIPTTQACDLPSLDVACTITVGCKPTAAGGTTTNPVCSDTRGVCTCPTNYYALNGQCVQAGGIGSVCLTSDPASCITDNAECSSATTRCVCSQGYQYYPATLTCDLPSLGQPCIVAIGCKPTAVDSSTSNAQCSGGVCACTENFYDFNGQCIRKSELTQTCNPDTSDSCSDPNAACVTSGTSSTCKCGNGYVISDSVCILGSSGDLCPPESGNTTPRPGQTGPISLTTPDVQVAYTCHEVPLLQSVTMNCEHKNPSQALQYGGWEKLVGGSWVNVDQTDITYINGHAAIPSLTVANAKLDYAGKYRCILCYGTGQTRCTISEEVTLHVKGSQIASVRTNVNPDPPQRGTNVTFTCNTDPADVADGYLWFRNGVAVSSQKVFTIVNIQTSSDGTYVCEATNNYGTVDSSANPIQMSVQYAPVFSLPSGANSQNVAGNLASDAITVECKVISNPSVHTYTFYDSNNQVVQSNNSRTLKVTNAMGYGSYSCVAENDIGQSPRQTIVVSEAGGTPGVGAATEDSGLSTGTIVAIVLGIIFLLLLIIIIIVCCCSYGWCRKKEKVQPEVVEQPIVAKPYIMRPVMSAGSTVSRRDVGILVKGNDFPDDQERWPYKTGYFYRLPNSGKQFIQEDEEPHYATPVMFPTTGKLYNTPEVAERIPQTGHISRKPPLIIPGEPEERYTPSPRYYLKPATNGGPIISMYDDKYSQPRPLQLPALDTQYLYVDDDEPKRRRHRRKKHRHERRDRFPRQSYYEADPDQEEVENKYAEVLDARSDDLVVVPGKQNYFE